MSKRLSDVQLIRALRKLNKPYFSVADLGKILRLKRTRLYVILNRLVKREVILRLKRGIYQVPFMELKLSKIAGELYYPSYLSFESALVRFGVINQVPYVLTLATTNRSKKMTLGANRIEFRQLKKELFFGFKLENSVYVAEPEKAVLDYLYMISKGLAVDETREWNLANLNKKKLLQYARQFPNKTNLLVENLVKTGLALEDVYGSVKPIKKSFKEMRQIGRQERIADTIKRS